MMACMLADENNFRLTRSIEHRRDGRLCALCKVSVDGWHDDSLIQFSNSLQIRAGCQLAFVKFSSKQLQLTV
jgi:hypothetical protein